MKSGVKVAIQYIVSLALGVLLIWYALREFKLDDLIESVKRADPLYIVISTILLTISHISRAIRWKILYKPLDYDPAVSSTFLALMSGYFVNQLVPRLGEVTRCGVLQKIEKIPLPISIGTVIAERMVDLLMLILLFIFTFYIEFDRLSQFFLGILGEKYKSLTGLSSFFLVAVVVLILGTLTAILVYNRFKEKIHDNKLFNKILGLAKNIFQGVISIKRIEKRGAFVFHTLVIWVMYFGASFVMVYSLPETSGLTILSGFSILLMGSLAMTTPVQGGIGAFELFVSAVLILYGISEKDGTVFAVVVHVSQYLFTLISGGICFLITFYVKSRNAKIIHEYSSQNS